MLTIILASYLMIGSIIGNVVDSVCILLLPCFILLFSTFSLTIKKNLKLEFYCISPA